MNETRQRVVIGLGVGLIMLVCCAVFICAAVLGSDQSVVHAAGSHSTHHIKFFSENNTDEAEKSVNEWIEEMNDDSSFNIIDITFDCEIRSGERIKVMVWYEV